MEPVTAFVFAKYPDPGRVKTRFVPPLTPIEAAQLHLASLRAVCENLRSRADLNIELVITPDESLDDFRNLFPSGIARFRLQGEGDLGQRLVRACDDAFADHDGPVLLLGADSPTLPTSIIDDAVHLLKTHDAVLGSCDDGGYYALGLARPRPALFDDIDWGSERVADQTRMRAVESGIDLVETDPWYDLDRFSDLAQAAKDLAAANESSPEAVALRCLVEGFIERYGHGRTDGP